MKELPILFSGAMVRAIIEGRKTQTRRVVKPQPTLSHWQFLPGYKLRVSDILINSDMRCFVNFHHTIPRNPEWDEAGRPFCPYGKPGDRLWVRETHSIRVHPTETTPGAVWYRESDNGRTWDEEGVIRWRPSIHMPRWASRINLEITGVRVERLQDISDADAKAEGIVDSGFAYLSDFYSEVCHETAIGAYRHLWESINGPGSWDENPWVWAIEFKRVEL